MKVVRTVFNGGDEETGLCRPRLVATQLGGAYTRHLDPDVHSPGKRNTQKIARKHLTLRARITRLVRKTIGFSKTIQMHDIVLGLFVNRYAFGLLV
jgi:insertion element IS1 protein InsB